MKGKKIIKFMMLVWCVASIESIFDILQGIWDADLLKITIHILILLFAIPTAIALNLKIK